MNVADLFKSYPGFPILLCVLLLVPAAAFALPEGRLARTGLRLVGIGVGITAALALLLAFANLFILDYVDNVEPTVVANGWIWWHGGTLYPALRDITPGTAGPELRGLLYGPLTFLLGGLAPTLFGASITISKLPPVVSFVGIVVVTWLACRRLVPPDRRFFQDPAFAATAAMTAVLGISEAPYWVRGDTVLMLIAAISTWLAARPTRQGYGRAVLLGLLAGSASALKLHGAAYAAPACLLVVLDMAGLLPLVAMEPAPWPAVWQQARVGRGLVAAGLIIVSALVAVAWPFLLPGIPLGSYAFYLELAAHHGFSLQLFLGNMTLVLGICLPILVLAWKRPADGYHMAIRWRILSGAGIACALLVALIASKPGAGYPHLLPFLPYAALILCTVLRAQSAQARFSVRMLGVGVLFGIAFCIPVLARVAVFASRGAEFATIDRGNQQIQEALKRHPGDILAVGYGNGSFLDLRLSYLRVLPVFAGEPLLYDATAMDDLWQGGVDRAIALRMIDACGVRAWLLPAGDPFTIRNYYGGYTFSAEFRALFAARYQPEDAQSTPFVRWVCRKPGSGS